MPNKLGEEWSKYRTLDSGVVTSRTRPYSITDSKLAYTVTSGEYKGEIVDSLPTTKLQYKCDFYLADEGTWTGLLDYLTPDVSSYYINIKLHTYIGSDYNRTTKKWNTLYEHHVWDFKIFAAVFDLGGGLIFVTLMGLYGTPTCKVYKSYTSTKNDVYTEPYKDHFLSTLILVGGDVQIGTASAYITVGDDSAAYSDWFFVEGTFPVDTGMYTKLIIDNADDYTRPINSFGTLLEFDNPTINTFFDNITGTSHITYKKIGQNYYDELRAPILDVVPHLTSSTYDSYIYRQNILDKSHKFMSFLVNDKLEKFLLYYNDSKVKIKSYNNLNTTEEIIVIEGASNPVGYFDKSNQIGYVFACKDDGLVYSSTQDFINWTEPVVVLDKADGKISKQSIGLLENADGAVYLLYYDTNKLPQNKLFNISEMQIESQGQV